MVKVGVGEADSVGVSPVDNGVMVGIALDTHMHADRVIMAIVIVRQLRLQFI